MNVFMVSMKTIYSENVQNPEQPFSYGANLCEFENYHYYKRKRFTYQHAKYYKTVVLCPRIFLVKPKF